MELIKKKFLLKTGSTYNLNILLTADIKDMGYFDTSDDYDRSSYSGYSSTPEYSLFNTSYTVTGTSESRLSELEKYVVSIDPHIKYYSGGSPSTDGLISYSNTPTGKTYVYYVGGIQYVDILATGSTATTTSFSFTNTGFSAYNFDNKFIVKYETKQNMVENPQVSSDVFIARQQQTVFENNFRLRGIGSLSDILSYAGGNYFTIYNNT